MIDREYAVMMARYNQWMNTRLYDSAAQLTDEQRKQDRGAFFKSLQGTLDHLISADSIWLHRFIGRSMEGVGVAGRFDDFDVMRAHRASLDVDILNWSQTLEASWLAADFHYYSVAYQSHYTRNAGLLVAHFFNHQTHHRGQATTLLMQFGIDPGATDLPAMPNL